MSLGLRCNDSGIPACCHGILRLQIASRGLCLMYRRHGRHRTDCTSKSGFNCRRNPAVAAVSFGVVQAAETRAQLRRWRLANGLKTTEPRQETVMPKRLVASALSAAHVPPAAVPLRQPCAVPCVCREKALADPVAVQIAT